MGQLIKYFCKINGLYLDYQKRFKSNYIKSVVNQFPNIPQNPRTDRPAADRSSMSLQISAGAGAVIFGVFGIISHMDGSIDFAPVYNYEIGNSELKG